MFPKYQTLIQTNVNIDGADPWIPSDDNFPITITNDIRMKKLILFENTESTKQALNMMRRKLKYFSKQRIR